MFVGGGGGVGGIVLFRFVFSHRASERPAGFLLKDPAGTQPQEPSSFSRLRVFSAGLRSSCAREKASMRRNRDWTGASAATQLRGG